MLSYERKPTPPPEALTENGKFTWGTFSGAVPTINPQEAKSPLGIPLPRFLQTYRLKEWQALQFGNARFFCLSAIYNSKALGFVQLVVIDREKKKKYLYERQLPPWKLRVARGLSNTVSASHGRGFFFSVHNHLDEGCVRHTILTEPRGQAPGISLFVEGDHRKESCAPMAICQPFGPNRALYSHKALMPMKGALEIGGEKVDFDPSDGFMIMDDHKGYYPFAMKYDWVTAAGKNDAGGLSGFNLTCNQVKDHHRYNENCLWENGRIHLLPPITVKRPEGSMGTWIIQDTHGRVDLRFVPEYDGRVDINALVFKTRYRAPYGHFEGQLVDDGGKAHRFDGFFGMGEDKFIRV